MMRTRTLAGAALALAALLGSNALAQNADADKDKTKDAGKEVTVRGVLAGVTVEGETAVNYQTRRAETVEATFLTIVGSPRHDATDRNRDRGAKDDANNKAGDRDRNRGDNHAGGRRRHNVYVVWVTPKTAIKDATAGDGSGASRDKAVETALDKVEGGDRVEVTFHRREFSPSGGNASENQKAMRHGRHRTYFGDAVSLTILAEPARQNTPRSDQDKDRDDDKDKTTNKANDKDKTTDKANDKGR